jgi:hypothetical protein
MSRSPDLRLGGHPRVAGDRADRAGHAERRLQPAPRQVHRAVGQRAGAPGVGGRHGERLVGVELGQAGQRRAGAVGTVQRGPQLGGLRQQLAGLAREPAHGDVRVGQVVQRCGQALGVAELAPDRQRSLQELQGRHVVAEAVVHRREPLQDAPLPAPVAVHDGELQAVLHRGERRGVLGQQVLRPAVEVLELDLDLRRALRAGPVEQVGDEGDAARGVGVAELVRLRQVPAPAGIGVPLSRPGSRHAGPIGAGAGVLKVSIG